VLTDAGNVLAAEQVSDDGAAAEREFSRREVLRAAMLMPVAASQVASPFAANSPARHSRARSVTFAFAGDAHFVDEWDTEGGTDYNGVPTLAAQPKAAPTSVLAPVAPLLSRADLAMLNLETAITSRGIPVAGKAYHFRSPAESFAAVKAAGVDVVNMANNHALDYGPIGLDDTFDAIARYRVPVVGIGHDASEAYRPYRTVINGQRIAIFGAVDWLEPALITQWTATESRAGLAFTIDPTRLLAGVKAVRAEVDTLVVFLHWGTEDTHCVSPEQHTLAQLLSAAGADIIVGSHAHRVFGSGHFDASFVAYGLGNFVWWREDGENGNSGVLLVTASGRRVLSYQWEPARIHHGIPVPERNGEAAADIEVWQERRACSGLVP